MKFIIHYNYRDVNDSFVIEGKTIEGCQKLVRKKLQQLGWDEDYCWSETII